MDKYSLFIIGMCVGVIVFGAMFFVLQEINDIPDNIVVWEEIGDDICRMKFNKTFVDWEDNQLYCEEQQPYMIDYNQR